jgi:hypothetical protein
MLPYLSMKEGSIFCFVIMISPKPRCFRLCYGTCHQKFSMNRGATTWFRMFGTTMWNLLIIEPFFHWIFWKTKIENYIGTWGVFLVLLESLHQVQFNKVDFVILRPKMWTILLKFWWVPIVVESSNKLQKGVWKENSIECIQTWANDIGYINV